jgi:hypothetical protein
MLFGQGMKATLFATHPPIIQRIQRIEPGFREQELGTIAKHLQQRTRKEAEREIAASKAGGKRAPFDPRSIIEGIGKPGWEQIMAAATLAASLPASLVSAARSAEWAPELLLTILLDRDEAIRDQQLFAIAGKLGAESETQVRYLMGSAMPIRPEQRLPLLGIAFPALKRRPVAYIQRMLDTVTEIIHLDGKIEVFEYLLAKVISLHLSDAINPAQSRTGGNDTLQDQAQAARDVIAILADHGHKERKLIHRSYAQGINSAGLESGPMQWPTDWVKTLDESLQRLDGLRYKDKERLITALMKTILSDTQVTSKELELLRAIGSALHVPIPLSSEHYK